VNQRLWIPIASLAAIAGIVTAVVVVTDLWTRDRVARNEAAQTMKLLATVLPEGSYDNSPEFDQITVHDDALGSAAPLPVYRARKAGRPSAVVLTVIARQGYVGPIRMLVCLTADGTVAGVRVTQHQETPGIGDGIEATKSAWISRFVGRSFGNPEISHWAVSRDGGDFDQLTGATITSRAVVAAVREAESYFLRNREMLLSGEPQR
jgi:electron transport complex protein RnfG